MNILAFDHFFDQDLDALRRRMGPEERLVVLPYRRLHRLAQRYFPQRAFGPLDAPYRGDMTSEWERYTRRAEAFADWLAAAHRPDVFVVPSDAFFYLRPVIARFERLGIHTVVLQKETTIAPHTMDEGSELVRRTVPFMSSAMAVCSERHREFAIRCGADPEVVVVTGQPRFDMYASAGTARQESMPNVLYLSYDDHSYVSQRVIDAGFGTWRTMRIETERVLADFASRGLCRLVAKLHPQQQAKDDALGDAVMRAPQGADTRTLVVAADVVVGFQSTALFEAVVARKPIVYAAWGDMYEFAEPDLIPFTRTPDMVHHARSAAELQEYLSDVARLSPPGDQARAEATSHLGPIDGRATERVLELVRSHAARGHLIVPPVPFSTLLVMAGGAARSPLLRLATAATRKIRPDLSGALGRHAGFAAQELTETRALVQGRLSGGRVAK